MFVIIQCLDMFVDINECDSVNCPGNSTCVNTDGSYECRCREGFIKKDKQCISKLCISL